MDNFEKHIRDNASQFDEYKADRAKLWVTISKELENEKPKIIPLWKSPILQIAASIALLLGITGIIGLSIFSGNTVENQYMPKELVDIDMHYQNLVSYQVQLVQNHPKLSEEDKSEFLSFMEELDLEYETLRLEMRKNLDNEQVLEAIVANYKKRIELIENLLKQINDSKLPDDDYGYTL
ncbi:hypothetical protein HME9304_02567 [Flagellimonas maritima]|uniref:Anti-sigma factor n=1 Tax=Flagellimonas maritima TaxID=1383885 RepID=A0A2Z4LUP1_9FLAO|nr:hypothetical protein [Allomuricauda aurantiaca]AWX45546.1 hypothetical protein HME9304_02567 [Allomuricauda aurantiaca]